MISIERQLGARRENAGPGMPWAMAVEDDERTREQKKNTVSEPGCRLIPTHSRFRAISLIYPKLDHDAVTDDGAKLSILLGRPELSTVRALQSRERVDKPNGGP